MNFKNIYVIEESDKSNITVIGRVNYNQLKSIEDASVFFCVSLMGPEYLHQGNLPYSLHLMYKLSW